MKNICIFVYEYVVHTIMTDPPITKRPRLNLLSSYCYGCLKDNPTSGWFCDHGTYCVKCTFSREPSSRCFCSDCNGEYFSCPCTLCAMKCNTCGERLAPNHGTYCPFSCGKMFCTDYCLQNDHVWSCREKFMETLLSPILCEKGLSKLCFKYIDIY
jgi:hypothetical protein